MAKEKNGIWFKLNPRHAMWQTDDKEIRLSNLPDDNGKIITIGFVANDDNMHAPYVLRSIDMGVLLRLPGEPKDKQTMAPKIENLTNKRDDEVVMNAKAKQLLRLSTESFQRTIDNVADANLLREAIMLESAGKNKAGKKREVVLQALKDRLETIGGMADDPKEQTTVLGGMADYREDEGVLRSKEPQT